MTTDQNGHSKGFAFVEFENEARNLVLCSTRIRD